MVTNLFLLKKFATPAQRRRACALHTAENLRFSRFLVALWLQDHFRRRSNDSQPRLAVSCTHETSLWLAPNQKNPAQAGCFLYLVHPAGFEPTITVPKTGVISISLRVQSHYHTCLSIFIQILSHIYFISMKGWYYIDMENPFSIPESVSRITHVLEKAGYEAYLVGGCVRDLFLGRPPKDWDVTTNAKPNEIIALFPKTFYENDYGTVGVVNEEEADETLMIVEVTPYRTESMYTDSRRPDSVSFDASLEDDLKRRDFTINAIAYNIAKNNVIDPFMGRIDLQKGLIKTVGSPKARFTEDALRMLRAIRIHAEIGFTIDTETQRAIEDVAPLLEKVAKERIRDEFTRMLLSDNPMEAMTICHNLGVIRFITPLLLDAIGVEQNQAHSFDVWTHLLKSLQHAADKKLPLHIRIAALFHDISKPETRRKSKETGEWTFYGHEVVGARRTKTILETLRFSKNITDIVVKLVRWHMFFSDTEQITLSAVRRMIANVGKDHVWDLMNLRMCDRIGTGRPKEDPYRLRKYQSMIEEVMHDPVSVGMLALNGQEIMTITNTPASPKIGFILHALLEEVLEDPEQNTKDFLSEKAIELAKFSEKDLKKKSDAGKEKKEAEEEKILKRIRGKYKVQ